jgi:hypothetical protein
VKRCVTRGIKQPHDPYTVLRDARRFAQRCATRGVSSPATKGKRWRSAVIALSTATPSAADVITYLKGAEKITNINKENKHVWSEEPKRTTGMVLKAPRDDDGDAQPSRSVSQGSCYTKNQGYLNEMY